MENFSVYILFTVCTALACTATIVHGYGTSEPPPKVDGKPLEVKVDLELINIAGLDLKDNELDLFVWPTYSWTDSRLAFNPATKGNVSVLRAFVDDIWVPDIFPYNAARKVEILSPKLAIVYPNGNVIWVPSTRMRIPCDLAEVKSKAGVNCTLKMGSWTFSGEDITLGDKPELGLSNYFDGSKYEILKSNATKNVKTYECCPDEPYEDIEFVFTLRQKKPKTSSSEEDDDEDFENGSDDDDDGDERDVAKEIEKLIRGEIKRNLNKATVVTRSKGFSKSFIWHG